MNKLALLAEISAADEAVRTSDAGCVLLVEDEPLVRRALRRLVEKAGHHVLEADSVSSAREQLRDGGVDVVLLDVGLPDESGLALLDDIGALPRAVSAVVLTGSDSRQHMRTALASGAVSYLRKSSDALTIEAQIELALQQARAKRKPRISSPQLQGSQAHVQTSWEQLSRKAADGLCRAWDLRHVETRTHVRRIAAYTKVLATNLGFAPHDAASLSDAATLHDLGKVAIPDAILCKPDRLTEQEFAIMKRHTVEGARMLGSIEHGFFERAALIALHHHERWNGSGYPDGLRGEDCPRDARIVGIVDVYDALGQARCYKPAWTEQQVSKFFREESGKLFDRVLVEALFDGMPQLREVGAEIVEAVDVPVS